MKVIIKQNVVNRRIEFINGLKDTQTIEYKSEPRSKTIKQLEFVPLNIFNMQYIIVDQIKYTIDQICYNTDDNYYEIIVKETKYIDCTLDKDKEILKYNFENKLQESRSKAISKAREFNILNKVRKHLNLK